MSIEFVWDAAKALANLHKHRVSFLEAVTAFEDSLSLTVPDPEHSSGEARYLLIGMTRAGRLVVVLHTDRGSRLRLISARLPTRRERECNEKGT